MRTKNTIALVCFFWFFLTLSASHAIEYNITPKDLPVGLPSKIEGKYRVIEHSPKMKELWVVYDVKGWEKKGDGILMYPPIIRYEYDEVFTKRKWKDKFLKGQ